ncbi:polysaccharide deacetylase family protein [Oryzifoliimicrobium ureilyticus]|uniref:polysaccharide deacetylase family protein n=1 Tax=Oryzifoliimicrobium ureilyticus TaxID=3113724 RepID=UPI0030766C3C
MLRHLLTIAFVCLSAQSSLSANLAVPTDPQIPATPSLPKSAGPHLLEPHLHIARFGQKGQRQVALTFDACMGKADERILSTLVSERIPATIFVTARWLRHNPEALRTLLANPDLFELENHGANHIPAVGMPVAIYGIPAAGSPAAVESEVSGGAAAMISAGIPAPHWFRGATAKYDPASIAQIRAMGYRIAGYSVNGDGGSLLGAAITEKHIVGAKDGDVVIAHINQPTHAAGEGVAKALIELKASGVHFVRLQDVTDNGDDKTTE